MEQKIFKVYSSRLKSTATEVESSGSRKRKNKNLFGTGILSKIRQNFVHLYILRKIDFFFPSNRRESDHTDNILLIVNQMELWTKRNCEPNRNVKQTESWNKRNCVWFISYFFLLESNLKFIFLSENLHQKNNLFKLVDEILANWHISSDIFTRIIKKCNFQNSCDKMSIFLSRLFSKETMSIFLFGKMSVLTQKTAIIFAPDATRHKLFYVSLFILLSKTLL